MPPPTPTVAVPAASAAAASARLASKQITRTGLRVGTQPRSQYHPRLTMGDSPANPTNHSALASLPKIDLHRHLEGSLRLSTLREVALQYDLNLPAQTLETLRPFVQIGMQEEHYFPPLPGQIRSAAAFLPIAGDHPARGVRGHRGCRARQRALPGAALYAAGVGQKPGLSAGRGRRLGAGRRRAGLPGLSHRPGPADRHPQPPRARPPGRAGDTDRHRPAVARHRRAGPGG